MSGDFSLNRRDLALFFAGVGATLALPQVALAQASGLTWKPVGLTESQAKILDVVAELIMPATDTPGAREARVPQFVDSAVAAWCKPKDALSIKRGLDHIEQDARGSFKSGFIDLKPEQQVSILTRYDVDAPETSASEVGHDDTAIGFAELTATPIDEPRRPFFMLLKEMVTTAYFTSQLGATKAARWDPVPGDYRGCVPVSEIGRVWVL